MQLIDAPVQTNTSALKEWAVAIDVLRAGEGMITVRKGGIREDTREFRMEHRRFALFPTYEHQNPAQLQDRYLPWLSRVLADAPAPHTVRIDTWATVTDVLELRDEAQVRALGEFYPYSQTYAVERLQWRPKKPLHVLVLRVYQLPELLVLPIVPAYGGCKSWIELETGVPMDTSQPALDDAAFEALRARALRAMS